MAADHPQWSTTSGQQDVERPRLVDPRGVLAREGQRVEAGHRAGGEDLAAQPQVPGRSRVVEQAITAADQEHAQHDREDQRRPVPGSGGCKRAHVDGHLDVATRRFVWRIRPITSVGHARSVASISSADAVHRSCAVESVRDPVA